MFEIIAPAGNIQSLAAAVKAGADAVYFGFKGQNARGRAENFDKETILKAIAYLKEKEIKSYITLNTIITDNELSLLEKRLKILSLCPPDAVIIQDFAVLELGKQILPEFVEFHASTQMGICNLDGLKFAEKCGINQVVLARELNFKELKHLSENTELKVEVFVFGAMCYSASGFCYASLKEQNRSGNRGVCAQVCRHNFNGNYPFSMKDLNLIEEIPKLVKAGIKHFKIEGRMKGADYVYTTVSALKELKKDMSEKGISKAKQILKEYPFLRETGKGYFYFPEKKDIFTKKKHSVQVEIGKVKSAKGKKIEFFSLNKEVKKGARIKINEKGATVLNIEKNTLTLSHPLKASKGDRIFLFPNKQSIKGISGIVNEIMKKLVPIQIALKVKAEKTGIEAEIAFKSQKQTIEIETEAIEAEKNPLTKETLLTKLKSPYFFISEISINENNLIFKPMVFKELKKKIKEFAENIFKENLKPEATLIEKYKDIEYQNPRKKCEILPPLYYSDLNKNYKCFVANNVGQLTFEGEKYTGKFLPICNKIAKHFLKQNFQVNGFLKPYELEPDKKIPYFVVRVKPEKLPKSFVCQKKGEYFVIVKKTD